MGNLVYGSLEGWSVSVYVYGSVYGYGDGSGDGSGYGYWSGYGDGSGYGYGYGDGSIKESVSWFVSNLTNYQKSLIPLNSTLAFWKSDRKGCPTNGGHCDPVYEGRVDRLPGPLKICTTKALHATYHPGFWSGTRIWLVALVGDIQEQKNKLAALERHIIAEVTPK